MSKRFCQYQDNCQVYRHKENLCPEREKYCSLAELQTAIANKKSLTELLEYFDNNDDIRGLER